MSEENLAAPEEPTPAKTASPDEVTAEDTAEEGPTPEQMAQGIVDLIRERSRTLAKLTRVDTIGMGETPLEPELRDSLVELVLSTKGYEDIIPLSTSVGALYLYSNLYLSDTYTRILLRVEEDNPYQLVAATVREESETYPRPTPAVLFEESTFGLDPDRLPHIIGEMLQLAEYADIKPIHASTGAIYLYSQKYLDAAWAESLVEWEEVGKHQSP